MELKDITYTLRANLKRLPLSADASAWRSKSAWRELRQAAFAGLARLTKGKFRITAAGTRALKALASVEAGLEQVEAGEVTDGPDLDAPEYRPHAASDLDEPGGVATSGNVTTGGGGTMVISDAGVVELIAVHLRAIPEDGGGEAVPDAAPPEGNAFDLDDPLPSENNE